MNLDLTLAPVPALTQPTPLSQFLDLMEAYLNQTKPFLAARTWETRQEHLLAFSRWLSEHGFTGWENAIRDWTADLLAQELSPNTVIARRETLSLFWAWTIEERLWTDRNPVRSIHSLCRQPSRRDAFTPDEVQAILLHRWPAGQGFWPSAIRVGWETGLRLADVALLRFDSLDLAQNLVRVMPQKTKRFGKDLVIPIPPSLATELDERAGMHVGPFIFAAMANHYLRDRQKTLSAQFARAAAACGLDGLSFHSLRHGCVTRLLAAGVAPGVVCSITGHSLAMLDRYNHPTLAVKRAALEGSKL